MTLIREHTYGTIGLHVQGSTASYPGHGFADAIMALADASEPYLGRVNREHVQLCPQNIGVLTEALAAELHETHPATRFRLHANVRVLADRVVRDATHVVAHPEYFDALARVHRALGADVYSLHAGRRNGPVDTLEGVFENVKRLEEALGCTVAVEGLYPDERRSFFLDDWASYAALLESDVAYALDLSHVQIVACRWGSLETSLVRELLESERCVEVHISDNDGFHDQHRMLTGVPWWAELVPHVHPGAVVFSEANQRREARWKT